jgi:hypothetical protein
MPNLDHSTQVTFVVLLIVFSTGIIIALGVTWMQQRSKNRAIDLLRVYAEKGQEPPAGVLDAVHRVNWPPGVAAPPPPRPATRGEHLSHVAGSVVLSAGAAGIAWWRAQIGDMGAWMIVAVIAAIFFAGSAAARLVAALTTRDGD